MTDLEARLQTTGYDPDEAKRLVRLIEFLLGLPEPIDPHGVFPDWARLRDRLGGSIDDGDPDTIEESFLELYAHLHMNQAQYSATERRRMDATGGYWNHAGGLSPLLKAEPWIQPDTLSADFGAGNGLQGLLLQILYPHAQTVQIEIAGRMAEIGDGLRAWLGIPSERVRWVVDDVMNVSAAGYDFIYLYRPVRPVGPGRAFYTRMAREIDEQDEAPVIFSIADCLRDFLTDRFEIFYRDGHLTCFRESRTIRRG